MDYSSKEYFDKMTAWWRAANYLSVGQLYLKDNPLLRRTLKPEDVKKHPIGHWGTIPGQNFIYVHLNRVINKYDLNMFYIEGPGHGGQALLLMQHQKHQVLSMKAESLDTLFHMQSELY